MPNLLVPPHRAVPRQQRTSGRTSERKRSIAVIAVVPCCAILYCFGFVIPLQCERVYTRLEYFYAYFYAKI